MENTITNTTAMDTKAMVDVAIVEMLSFNSRSLVIESAIAWCDQILFPTYYCLSRVSFYNFPF